MNEDVYEDAYEDVYINTHMYMKTFSVISYFNFSFFFFFALSLFLSLSLSRFFCLRKGLDANNFRVSDIKR